VRHVDDPTTYTDVVVQNRQPAREGSGKGARYLVYAEVRVRKTRSARKRRIYRVAGFGGDQDHARRLAARIADALRAGKTPEAAATGPE
jgi:hypothetical protein